MRGSCGVLAADTQVEGEIKARKGKVKATKASAPGMLRIDVGSLLLMPTDSFPTLNSRQLKKSTMGNWAINGQTGKLPQVSDYPTTQEFPEALFPPTASGQCLTTIDAVFRQIRALVSEASRETVFLNHASSGRIRVGPGHCGCFSLFALRLRPVATAS